MWNLSLSHKKNGLTFLFIMTPWVSIPVQASNAWDNTIWGGYSEFFNPDWDKDFSVTTGVKIWMTEWRRDSFFVTSFFSTVNNVPISLTTIDSKPSAQTSNLEAVPIPQLSARYKWFFFTGSYFASTDFNFDQTNRSITAASPGLLSLSILNEVDTTTASRYEYDLSGGVYVHPNVAILGGFKRIRQTVNFTSNFNAINFVQPSLPIRGTLQSKNDIDVYGPTIGIAGSVPIGKGFGIYANYAHGFMSVDIRDFNITSNRIQQVNTDASYDIAELGFTYTYGMSHLPVHLPLSAATFYAGYRWQSFNTEFPNASSREDTTRGFAAGINLSW